MASKIKPPVGHTSEHQSLSLIRELEALREAMTWVLGLNMFPHLHPLLGKQEQLFPKSRSRRDETFFQWVRVYHASILTQKFLFINPVLRSLMQRD